MDINLLTVLGALLEQRNLTRAGEQLRLSQPAMSGALARLRQHFGDELLIRSGRGYQLTPLAQGLLPAVREALGQVELTLKVPPRFDPAASRRRFSVAVSAHSLPLLHGLVQRVRVLAPQVQIETWPVTTALLETGRSPLAYDVLIAPRGFCADGEGEELARDRLVYVADPGNSRLRGGRLSAADLAALPHAAARLPPEDLVTAALRAAGVTPRVAVTTGGWLPLPFLVAGTDLVAAVPERLARRVAAAAGVTLAEVPLGRIELVEAAWWHPLHATDPALTWLRHIVRQAAVSLAGGGGEFAADFFDEEAHFVGGVAEVAVGCGEYGEV